MMESPEGESGLEAAYVVPSDLGAQPGRGGGSQRTATSIHKRQVPSLRPPTLMIDLLFGALMLFAFQMGDPSARLVVPRDFELPTSAEKADSKPDALLPLKPVNNGANGWAYETPDGRRLGAEAVAKASRQQKKTPILLVTRNASVQSYLDAEQPLRRLGLKVGLAVALEGDIKK